MKFPVPLKVLVAIIEYVEEEKNNILTDMENKGRLRPVLDWLELHDVIEG